MFDTVAYANTTYAALHDLHFVVAPSKVRLMLHQTVSDISFGNRDRSCHLANLTQRSSNHLEILQLSSKLPSLL